jgi:hypothetical protein
MEEVVSSNESKRNWQETVDAWRASGLSKTEFCKKHKVGVSALYYWVEKLNTGEFNNSSKGKKSSKPKPKSNSVPRKKSAGGINTLVDDKPAFVEISIPKSDNTSPAGGQVFRITTSYGAVMEIPI